jgi:hypothetical protein
MPIVAFSNSRDELVPVLDDISTIEVSSTWTDDHILCCTVLVNKSQNNEREQEVWWCGWEGVAAFTYYNDSSKARDHVHGYGLLTSDLFDEDLGEGVDDEDDIAANYRAFLDETQAELMREHALHAEQFEQAHFTD